MISRAGASWSNSDQSCSCHSSGRPFPIPLSVGCEYPYEFACVFEPAWGQGSGVKSRSFLLRRFLKPVQFESNAMTLLELIPVVSHCRSVAHSILVFVSVSVGLGSLDTLVPKGE